MSHVDMMPCASQESAQSELQQARKQISEYLNSSQSPLLPVLDDASFSGLADAARAGTAAGHAATARS